jgi:hypothetical protein
MEVTYTMNDTEDGEKMSIRWAASTYMTTRRHNSEHNLDKRYQ